MPVFFPAKMQTEVTFGGEIRGICRKDPMEIHPRAPVELGGLIVTYRYDF
jgi:hypothetical protein